MITWDEPENYYVGRVYLNMLTGQDIPQALPYRADSHWERYPPFAITIASAFSWIVSETLNLSESIDAHHIAVIGFGALAAVATYGVARELGVSLYGAVIASVVLFFSPVFFGHVHTNPKDIPQSALFTLAIYAGLVAVRKKTYTAYVCAGVVWGCALATKFNALFVPAILGLWFLLKHHTHTPGVWVKYLRHIVLYGCIGLITLIILWPWLVLDPMKHVGQIVQYIGEVGRGLNVLFFGQLYSAGVDVPWWYAPTMVIVQTPLVLLFFVLIGILWASIRKRIFLPVVWLIVVFARYIDPRVIIYNGARHVMEVFPAMALLIGMGVQEIWDRFPRSLRYPRVLITGAILTSLLLPIISLHPYEAMYYNELVGGVASASKNFDFDYWGFSVGELVTRVNAIEKDKARRVYILWLGFPAAYFPANKLQFVTTEAEQADYVIIPNSRNFFDGATAYWKQHGRLVYTVRRGGADIGYLFATTK